MTLPLLLVLMATGFAACNTEKIDTVNYTSSSSVTIKEFKLTADEGVAKGLDSVFFSIDLENGVIFNADSLPVGTDVTRLKPKITFASSVSIAKIIMKDGKHRVGEVNYLTDQTDTIDFTGKVILQVASADGSNSKDYHLKVNVHTVNPDTISWDFPARTELPSRLSSPKSQKTIAARGKAWSLIEENNGTFTIADASTPDMRWRSTEVDFPKTPNVRSFCASNNAFYTLAIDGTLMTSPDGEQWTSTGQTWTTLLGGFGDNVIGLKKEGTSYSHVEYPSGKTLPMSSAFPVSDMSPVCIMDTKWAENPIAFVVGGTTASGDVNKASWGYDGTQWVQLSEDPAPALISPSLTPYYIYRTISGELQKYRVWIMTGGKNTDGTINKNVYVTYNSGISWGITRTLSEIPDEMIPFYAGDIISLDTKKEVAVSAAWSRASADFTVENGMIKWSYPLLYKFGGLDEQGNLINDVVMGLLLRLSFTPIF